MKARISILITVTMLALAVGVVIAQSGNDLFQQALVKERTEGNMAAAIALYQTIVEKHASDRALVARALVQMGQCYEKLGRNEALKAYERVVFEFGDQTESATTARARLAILDIALRSSARLSAEKQILHALSRLTFGARPGDIERVRAMGTENWIDLQLHPERIEENPVLEAKLRPMKSLRMTSSQIAQAYPVNAVLKAMGAGLTPYPVDPEDRRAVELAVAFYQSRQPGGSELNAEFAKLVEPAAARILRARTSDEKLSLLESLPEQLLPRVLAAVPQDLIFDVVLKDTSWERVRKINFSWRPTGPLAGDTFFSKLLRETYSNRQLDEVLADFWFNHFNVYASFDAATTDFITAYERDAIRPNVLGKFKDLLRATAQSPAMLDYLDNTKSVDPKAFERLGRPPGPGESRGLNENYARELMELHTLGVDGGYTQQDVLEVARCFTGWTYRGTRQGDRYVFTAQTLEFEFNADMHDPDGKTVLGVKIPAGGGIEDGQRVLDILAHHPSTARFISRRLAQRFLADDPPAAVVQKMAQTFTRTEGDIREVLKTMFSTAEFWSESTYRSKMKSPLEMAISAVRALDADVEAGGLYYRILELGQPVYHKREPTGYSNHSDEWTNATQLLARMNFAQALATNRVGGVRVDLRRLDKTQPSDPLRVATALLPGGVSQQTRAAIATGSSLAEVVGLILGSPDFQRR